jgi:hypothetical protein
VAHNAGSRSLRNSKHHRGSANRLVQSLRRDFREHIDAIRVLRSGVEARLDSAGQECRRGGRRDRWTLI